MSATPFAPLSDGGAHPHAWPTALVVAGRDEAVRWGLADAATHVVAMSSPEAPGPDIGPDGEGRALRLRFDDVIDPDHPNAPPPEAVDAIIGFVDALPRDARLLVHCRMGISRSTAVALGILARAVPPEEAGAALHAIRPWAAPNELMVAQWDRRLKLRGALKRIGWRFPCEQWRPRPQRSSRAGA